MTLSGDCFRTLSWFSRSSLPMWASLLALTARAIGADALIRHPCARGQFSRLPEHVDRHAAARVEIAADAQAPWPQHAHELRADRDRAGLVEGAVIAEAVEIELQRLRLDEPGPRHVVDDQGGEIGLPGHRAHDGEFGKGEAGKEIHPRIFGLGTRSSTALSGTAGIAVGRPSCGVRFDIASD
jgi:hypothetical protein